MSKKYYCPRCNKQMKEEMVDRTDGFAVIVSCECGFRKQLWTAIMSSGGGSNERKATKKTS